MSNDNRDYPAWLDEELFAGLTEEEPSAAPQSAPEEKASGTEKAAPKKKAKPSKDKDGAKKPKAKKSAPEPGDEPKPKKKKAAAKETPDADKNMPAEPEKAEAPEQSEASEKPEKDEKAEKGKKPGKAEKKAPADKAGDRKKPRKSAEELVAEEAERERARMEKQSKARGAARKWLIAMIVIVSLAAPSGATRSTRSCWPEWMRSAAIPTPSSWAASTPRRAAWTSSAFRGILM